MIGICNSWSELVNCNVHLRGLAESVKRGVLQAGGFPLEFPVLSLGESLMKPTTMLYRNLMAMDVEESIRAYPLDGVVLLTGATRRTPRASWAPRAPTSRRSSSRVDRCSTAAGAAIEIGSCSDCWHYHEELRAGRITEAEWVEIENGMSRSNGHCMTMGTASTMACVTEALGLTLPGGAAIPAVDSRRHHLAEAAGRQIVALVDNGIKPSDILTREAFENAIRVLHAISGSTNAILHLLAYAGRVGVELPLQLFDELCATTPWLVDLKPAGRFLMEDFYYAGGVPAVMTQIDDLLSTDVITVTGRTVGENIAGAEIVNAEVIRTRREPLDEGGALVVLRGNLCPDGAVMKISAAEPALHRARGTGDRLRRHSRPGRARRRPGARMRRVQRDGASERRSCRSAGHARMGHLPIPAKLLRQGVTDLVRISDARMSGTSYGAVVLHVAPESAVGGPLALVETGDLIRLNVAERRLDMVVAEDELSDRRSRWTPPARSDERGYRHLHATRCSRRTRAATSTSCAGRHASSTTW